ncbi:MAG: hypothetical protein E7157_03265 [Lactobacillales bacterium]|nr:hypothetical protein [Lactobacillales bacterium]
MKVLDKLKREFKCNKKGLLFLFGITIIGFLFGVLFITIISESDKLLIKDYVQSFINSIRNNKINLVDNFKNIFFSNFSFILIVWLLGMSVIGIPINIFYYFINSFILGFSITAFILTYKLKGCIFSLIYIIPHSIINLLVFTILIYYTINFSLTLIFAISKKKSINFKTIINQYLKVFIFSFIVIVLTSLYEAFVIPNIMNKLLFIIK